MKKPSYCDKYKEIQVLGRGSFGVAHLVTDKKGLNRYYVAKKVFLSGINQEEKSKSFLEVDILAKLNSPFIVKYIESFLEDSELIVIMEYCENGDLSFYINNHKKKKQSIPELIIANWFVQLCLGLKHIHENKILHRDIKTTNIFLNSNGIIKIGDFGISKVLETIGQSAHTFTGTPYYLSPEVCSSQSYGYKSDIWALGCVLYELCTLNFAFQAGSLLGLVRKIVEDKVQKIPKQYSQQLSNIIMKLLSKDVKYRPDMIQIFDSCYIKNQMKDFLKRGGRLDIHVPVKGTTLHEAIKNETISTTVSSRYQQTRRSKEETPAESMRRRKEEEAMRREQVVKKASKECYMTQNQARLRKNQQLYGTQNYPKHKQQVVDYDRIRKVLATDTFKKKAAHAQKEAYDDLQADFPSLRFNPADDRPLPSTLKQVQAKQPEKKVEVNKKEDSEEELQEYNDQDFQEYEEEDIRITARATQGELDKVNEMYQQQLNNQSSLVNAPLNKVDPVSTQPSKSFLSGMIGSKVSELRNTLGKEVYSKIYACIEEQRGKFNDQELYRHLSKRFPGVKVQHFQTIEQILYFEEFRKAK